MSTRYLSIRLVRVLMAANHPLFLNTLVIIQLQDGFEAGTLFDL